MAPGKPLQLPPDLAAAVDALAKRSGGSAEQLVRDAVREYVAIREFRRIREQLMSEGTGPVSDEDIADQVS